jgi:hypothetical protein
MTSTTVIAFTSIVFLALASLRFFVVRTDSATTISCQQLAERSSKWQEPKVALWAYQGTTKGYHYFDFYDLPGHHEKYAVSEKEMHIVAPFPFTTNRNKWRVLPWGPARYEADKEGIPHDVCGDVYFFGNYTAFPE